jgi:hypothetical protein
MAPLGDEKPADGKEEEGIPREKAKSKVQKKKKQQQDQWGRRDVPAEHKHEKGGHQQHGGADGAGKNVRGARQRTREKLDAAVSRGPTMTLPKKLRGAEGKRQAETGRGMGGRRRPLLKILRRLLRASPLLAKDRAICAFPPCRRDHSDPIRSWSRRARRGAKHPTGVPSCATCIWSRWRSTESSCHPFLSLRGASPAPISLSLSLSLSLSVSRPFSLYLPCHAR